MSTDDRLKKPTVATARDTRAAEERSVTENRQISDDECVEMFRQQFFQSALPDLPKIPGWHLCWLTTTNPRDSIQTRMRLGYEPVKPSDVPGWEYATLKTGDWQGFIGVNEMLAFKLPQSLYEKFMQEAHHDAPQREEDKLADTANFLEQQARAQGADVVMGDGMRELGTSRGRAQFELT